jgi:arylsulfatase A-like enzyme
MLSTLLRLVALIIVAQTGVVGSAAAAERPNVLFLMVDDLRPELGCYGVTEVKTPNIDALAAVGVRFERAYVQYPLCNPSRSSMLTGRYPTTTGVLDNNTWFGAAHADWPTIPRHFKNNGFASLRTGKIFHGGIDDADAWTAGGEERKFEGARTNPQRPPNRQQLSDRIVALADDGQEHNDYKTADRAIAYLREHRDTPFLLCCGFTKPHSPPTAPQKFLDMYAKMPVTLPVDFAARPAAPAGFPPPSITRNGDLFIDRDASPDQAKEMIRAYRASTSWTDWNVGRVLAELDAQKLREKTIIVFWGDHGYHLGEKGKWSKHGSLYEIGTRVPLIVSVPGKAGSGKSSPRTIESLDIYPTLCELCGLTPPAGLEGQNFAKLLDDPQAEWHNPAISVYGTNQKVAGAAIRNERYRYAEYDGGQAGAMLIDETADPAETKNLVDDPQFQTVRDELAGQLHKLLPPLKP